MDTGIEASSALGHTDARLLPSIFSEPVCAGANWLTPQGVGDFCTLRAHFPLLEEAA